MGRLDKCNPIASDNPFNFALVSQEREFQADNYWDRRASHTKRPQPRGPAARQAPGGSPSRGWKRDISLMDVSARGVPADTLVVIARLGCRDKASPAGEIHHRGGQASLFADELLGIKTGPECLAVCCHLTMLWKQPKQARSPWIFFSASRVAWWCQEIPLPSALRRIVRGSAIHARQDELPRAVRNVPCVKRSIIRLKHVQ